MTTTTTSIKELVDAHAQRMQEDLTRYLEVETPSDDEEALRSGLAWVEGWMASRLGEPDSRVEVPAQGYGDHRVLEYAGTAPGLVVVLGHYDTVWPLGTLAGWPVTVDGDRLTGPGAFDMKGGLVQFVYAVVSAREAGWELPTLRVILNGDEEVGSVSSRPTIEKYSEGADAVLVFEASSGGAVKTARKGVGLFTVEVEGVEAHAGLDPLAGASAVHELAGLVTRLAGATDLGVGTSVNVGVIEGGTRPNVKAGHAVARLDVRVDRESEMERIDALMDSLAPESELATVTVSGGWNRPVMERKPGAVRLFELARDIAAEQGFELQEISVGGASDGNFAAAKGLDVLDGLGAVGNGAHARGEWLSLSGMRQRTALVAQLLRELGRRAGAK